MSINFIIDNDNFSLGFKPNEKGVCLILVEKDKGSISEWRHFHLDYRDLTLIQAEIDDIIFDLQDGDFDETDPAA